MPENFKHTYEYSPARMRLGLRVSPLITLSNNNDNYYYYCPS